MAIADAAPCSKCGTPTPKDESVLFPGDGTGWRFGCLACHPDGEQIARLTAQGRKEHDRAVRRRADHHARMNDRGQSSDDHT